MNYSGRVKKVLSRLRKKEALLLTDMNDIFYLSGFSGTFAKIIMTAAKPFFISDFRYKGTIEKLRLSDFFEVVISKNPPADTLNLLKPASHILVNKTIPFSEYSAVKKKLSKPVSASALVSGLRMVKDSGEIALIKKSASLTEAGIQHLVSIMKPGITERELALEFEWYIRKNGAEAVSFLPIIAFNANSAIPHHTPGDTKLAKNTIILIDVGARYEGYCSDLTRMVGFGIIQPRLKELKNRYNMVKTAKAIGVSFYRKGLASGKADRKVREYFDKEGMGPLFTHSLGHGTGIEIHEEPYARRKAAIKLKENMVLTCEPGIYFENGYGIRIEDDYIITDNFATKLSAMDDNLILL